MSRCGCHCGDPYTHDAYFAPHSSGALRRRGCTNVPSTTDRCPGRPSQPGRHAASRLRASNPIPPSRSPTLARHRGSCLSVAAHNRRCRCAPRWSTALAPRVGPLSSSPPAPRRHTPRPPRLTCTPLATVCLRPRVTLHRRRRAAVRFAATNPRSPRPAASAAARVAIPAPRRRRPRYASGRVADGRAPVAAEGASADASRT